MEILLAEGLIEPNELIDRVVTMDIPDCDRGRLQTWVRATVDSMR